MDPTVSAPLTKLQIVVDVPAAVIRAGCGLPNEPGEHSNGFTCTTQLPPPPAWPNTIFRTVIANDACLAHLSQSVFSMLFYDHPRQHGERHHVEARNQHEAHASHLTRRRTRFSRFRHDISLNSFH